MMKECDKEVFHLFCDLFLYTLFPLSHLHLTEHLLRISCQYWARKWDYKYK